MKWLAVCVGVVVGATVLALFAPHPNVAHLGYSPVGFTIIDIYLTGKQAEVGPRNLNPMFFCYSLGWVLSAAILSGIVFIFMRFNTASQDHAAEAPSKPEFNLRHYPN
jgi:hypothetical protein